jgi:hypothetical protein
VERNKTFCIHNRLASVTTFEQSICHKRKLYI